MTGPHSSEGARPFVPPRATSLAVLKQAADACRGCDLYKRATQAVFGEVLGGVKDGPGTRMMLVGEQPGDREDVEGRPFVGPAGQLLDRALAEAGIDRSRVYVTNAVKHFKWTQAPRGKRRIHSKPSMGEIRACRPWLERELAVFGPQVVVCLGATAAGALLGPAVRVTKQRGSQVPAELVSNPLLAGVRVFVTVHPSSLLRLPGGADRAKEFERFVSDLRGAV